MKPDRIIVIGTSTGGPKALVDLFASIDCKIKTPVVVAVHTPIDIAEVIASGLEKRLSQAHRVKYKTAAHNEDILDGTIYFSPGKKHTFINGDFMRSFLRVSDEPSMTLFKPSVDLLFVSAANAFKSGVMGIILTGLSTGKDGVEGCRKIKEMGGMVIAQNKNTSECFGMPKNIIDARLADAILPIKLIANKMKMFSC